MKALAWIFVFGLTINLTTERANGQSRLSLAGAADRLQRYFLFEGAGFNGKRLEIDLVFVIQGSNSIGALYFKNFIAFVGDLLRYTSVSGQNTRVGVVTYGSQARVQFYLNSYTNRDCVVKALSNIEFPGGENSVTGSGLEMAYKMLQDTSRGARTRSKQMVFLLSNGYTRGGPSPVSQAREILSSKRRRFYLFGIGTESTTFRSYYTLGWRWRQMYLYTISRVIYLGAIIRRCTKVEKKDTCCGRRIVYDECKRRCSCVRGKLVNCCRVRKDFTSMSVVERARYLKAYKTLTTVQPYKAQYDTFINIHVSQFFTQIHSKSQFLPWHRWYILTLENLLRQIDCRVTVPYWAWSMWSHNPWSASSIWGVGPGGFGGNGIGGGGCVNTGQFRNGVWSRPNGACLRRDHFGSPPDEVAIASSLALTDFTDFELNLRGNLHDNVHCLIGGTMCSTSAAEAPEFFLHHGYVDKLWNDWQKISTANKNVYFPGINGNMVSTPYQRKDFIDIANQPGCVKVCYDDPAANNARVVTASLRAQPMRTLMAIPRVATTTETSKARQLFKLSAAEEKRLNEIQRSIQGRTTLSRNSVSLNSLDRVLGFHASTETAVPSLKIAMVKASKDVDDNAVSTEEDWSESVVNKDWQENLKTIS